MFGKIKEFALWIYGLLYDVFRLIFHKINNADSLPKFSSSQNDKEQYIHYLQDKVAELQTSLNEKMREINALKNEFGKLVVHFESENFKTASESLKEQDEKTAFLKQKLQRTEEKFEIEKRKNTESKYSNFCICLFKSF